MLLIPVGGKISLKNPPIITLSIILINLMVLVLFQSADTRKFEEALDYYFQSDLAHLELSHYVSYRNDLGDRMENSDDNEKYWELYRTMQKDRSFQKALKSEKVITSSSTDYIHWKALRREYEARLETITSYRYGFIPAKKKLLTSVTYMFLHGGLGHFLGNMIFLWLIGVMLEFSVGRTVYLLVYVIGGVLSAFFYYLVNQYSTMPLVGASGAISAMMGAFAVLFGKKKVKVFLSLGFYFNYLNITALVLLPVWLIKELFMQVVSPMDSVAYMAHFGGLLGGALISFIIVRFTQWGDISSRLTEEPVDNIQEKMKNALKHIENLEMTKGRRILQEVLAMDPDHLQALTHLFHIDKLKPKAKEFHETTRTLLTYLIEREEYHKMACDIYNEYAATTKKVALSPIIYMRMSYLLSIYAHYETAEKMLTILIEKKADLPELPDTILKVANQLELAGFVQKSYYFKQLLITLFPNTPEAHAIREVRTL